MTEYFGSVGAMLQKEKFRNLAINSLFKPKRNLDGGERGIAYYIKNRDNITVIENCDPLTEDLVLFPSGPLGAQEPDEIKIRYGRNATKVLGYLKNVLRRKEVGYFVEWLEIVEPLYRAKEEGEEMVLSMRRFLKFLLGMEFSPNRYFERSSVLSWVFGSRTNSTSASSSSTDPGTNPNPKALTVLDLVGKENNGNETNGTSVVGDAINWLLDWRNLISFLIAGGRDEVVVGKDPVVHYGNFTGSSSTQVVIVKKAQQLRRHFGNWWGVTNSTTEGIGPDVEPTTLLGSAFQGVKKLSRHVGEDWFGVYNEDEDGGRGINFIEDLGKPVVRNLIHNETFVVDVSNFIADTMQDFWDQMGELDLHKVIKYIRANIGDRFSRLKSVLYDSFFGDHAYHTIRKFYTIYRSKLIGSYNFRRDHNNKEKRKYLHQTQNTMSYIYDWHNTRRNPDRVQTKSPYEYIVSYIPGSQFESTGEEGGGGGKRRRRDMGESGTNTTTTNKEEKKEFKRIRETPLYRSFLNVKYYDGIYPKYRSEASEEEEEEQETENKDRFLPEYPGTPGEDWVFSIFDFFDPRFWDPREAWFTGFAPGDRRKIRVIFFIFWLPFVGPTPGIPVPVAADTFSLIGYTFSWVIRSNLTRSFFPFITDIVGDPDPENCIEDFPFLPRTEFGCEFPRLENMPYIFPPENLTDLFVFPPTFCLPYRNPLTILFYIIQGILTSLLSALIPQDSVWLWFFSIASRIVSFIFGIDFEFILPDPEQLPVGLWQCVLPQLPLLFILAAIIIAVGIEVFFSCVDQCRMVFTSSGIMTGSDDIADLRHEMTYLLSQIRRNDIMALKNRERIKDLRRECCGEGEEETADILETTPKEKKKKK
jgi:hypothetical protein